MFGRRLHYCTINAAVYLLSSCFDCDISAEEKKTLAKKVISSLCEVAFDCLTNLCNDFGIIYLILRICICCLINIETCFLLNISCITLEYKGFCKIIFCSILFFINVKIRGTLGMNGGSEADGLNFQKTNIYIMLNLTTAQDKLNLFFRAVENLDLLSIYKNDITI